jgi:hypothetical protein
MNRYIACLAVGGLILAGCGGAGNGTAEHMSKADSAAKGAAADSQMARQQIPQMPPVPDGPPPKPLGWSAFDDYYEQLSGVLDLEVKSEGRVPTAELKTLQERAETLAKDTDPAGTTTVSQRKILALQTRQIADMPDSMLVFERVRALHPVLETSRMIAEMAGKGEGGPYIQRLQLAQAQIEALALRLQQQQVPPKP